MHDGDHDIIKDAGEDFDRKFSEDNCGSSGGHEHHGQHGHSHGDGKRSHDHGGEHGHEHKKPSGMRLEVAVGIVVAAIILVFVYYRFFQ